MGLYILSLWPGMTLRRSKSFLVTGPCPQNQDGPTCKFGERQPCWSPSKQKEDLGTLAETEKVRAEEPEVIVEVPRTLETEVVEVVEEVINTHILSTTTTGLAGRKWRKILLQI